MDKREYLRVVQVGGQREVCQALQEELDAKFSVLMARKKLVAASYAKPGQQPGVKTIPEFYFGSKFFTKLSFIPSVAIDVNESRSSIRRTSYGYRDRRTGERVYMRIEWPGSIVEFRDGRSGYLVGRRYLIPGFERMRQPVTWRKISKKVTRVLTANGIIVKDPQVKKWMNSFKPRIKLTRRLMILCIASRLHQSPRLTWSQRRNLEKAIEQISQLPRNVRNTNAARPPRPKP